MAAVAIASPASLLQSRKRTALYGTVCDERYENTVLRVYPGTKLYRTKIVNCEMICIDCDNPKDLSYIEVCDQECFVSGVIRMESPPRRTGRSIFECHNYRFVGEGKIEVT